MADDWQPTASLNNVRLRATIYKQIRQFFEDRGVLEVETPLLCHSTTTDPHIASFETSLHFSNPCQHTPLYLQTSPEFAMKRLLAAGIGSIFQICKAFRNGEVGRHHNPEFTLLEWYKVGFTHHDLMNEVNELLQLILKTSKAEKMSYLELFDNYLAINPHVTTPDRLKKLAKKEGLLLEGDHPRDIWLDLLLTHLIEPQLGREQPIFIYDYPASQAALAKIKKESNYEVGERFEVYYKGIELANGYHELSDAKEQVSRFEKDNLQRKLSGLPTVPIDNFLLAALPSFPKCAGVALGIDRLLYSATDKNDIAEVISFPITRA